MRFRITLDELLAKSDKTQEEEKFVHYFYQRMPLGTAPCTINKICWKLEEIFDNTEWCSDADFDYSILKCDVEYSNQLYNKIKKIYDQYKREASNYMQYAKSERIKSEERQMQRYMLREQFKRQCLEQCPNEEYLCNIVLDLCYTKANSSKQFAWDVCGDIFIRNLLKRHNNRITYPALDKNGDIEFNGLHFCMRTTEIIVNDDIEKENGKCQLY